MGAVQVGRGGGADGGGGRFTRGDENQHPRRYRLSQRLRGVALQVAFERQTLKPVFSLDRL